LTLTLLPALAAQAADATRFYEPCTSKTEEACIESVIGISGDGLRVAGVPTGRYNYGPLSSNDAYLAKIDGRRAEWDFPGLKFTNGNSKATIATWYWPSNFLHCWNNGVCAKNEEEIDLYMRPSDLDGARPPVILNSSDGKIVCPNNPQNCNIGSPPWEFGEGFKFEVSLRTPKAFRPAFTQGRTRSLQIEKLRESETFNVYRMSFSPLSLDNVYFALADIFAIDHGLYTTDEPAIWLYGQNNNHARPLGSCVSIGGLSVVTNAFTMTAPSWNYSTQTLDVKLAASHVRTDGSLNEGYLEVRVPLKMASCMWGIELRDKVQARFALTYEDGSPSEVLTVVGGIQNNDYVLISAGFHYSSPKVSIKLDGAKVTASQPLEEPTSVIPPVTAKKTTITCVSTKNKKLTKKVTAVGPKCPAGYKKK
jgi:hypothetical protein